MARFPRICFIWFFKPQRLHVVSSNNVFCSRTDDGGNFMQLRSRSSPQRARWSCSVHHSRPQFFSPFCETSSVGYRYGGQLFEAPEWFPFGDFECACFWDWHSYGLFRGAKLSVGKSKLSAISLSGASPEILSTCLSPGWSTLYRALRMIFFSFTNRKPLRFNLSMARTSVWTYKLWVWGEFGREMLP